MWVDCFMLSREIVSEDQDRQRFMMAFAKLLGSPTLKWWPMPAHVIERLEPRPSQPRISNDKHGGECAGQFKQLSHLLDNGIDIKQIAAGMDVNGGKLLPNESQRAAGNAREKV